MMNDSYLKDPDFRKWVFHAVKSFVVPGSELKEVTSPSGFEIMEGDVFQFKVPIKGDLLSIELIREESVMKFTLWSNYMAEIIIHNSDRNESHESPFFIECHEAIERERVIDNVLKD